MDSFKNKRIMDLEVEEERESKIRKKVTKPIDENRFCEPYTDKIYAFQLRKEIKRRPEEWNYMENLQTEIGISQRTEMVNEILLIAYNFRSVNSETIYLGISVLDQFLSLYEIPAGFSLLPIPFTCLFIASKFVDSNCCLDIMDVRFVDGLDKDEVFFMEGVICNHLKFELGKPTTYTFLRKFIKAALKREELVDTLFEFVCSYIGEVSLCHFECLRYPASVIAGAIVFLGSMTVRPDLHPWPSNLRMELETIPVDFEECMVTLHQALLHKHSEFNIAKAKYQEEKLGSVASRETPSEIPKDYLE